MCYPVLKITQSLKHGVKVRQTTVSLLLFVSPKLQSLEPPYKLNLYERFHNRDSHSWTTPISALIMKHTYLLHGMASTLRMRTTISSGRWHHKQLFRPCWASSTWYNRRTDEQQSRVSKVLYYRGECACKSTPNRWVVMCASVLKLVLFWLVSLGYMC